MLLVSKSQYSENDYITQSNLQIQCNLYKITNGIFHRIWTKKNLQFMWKHKRPQIAKVILRKKNRVGEIRLPDFRLNHKATVSKKVWYWHKNWKRQKDRKDRKPRDKLTHLWSQVTIGSTFVYDKGGKKIKWRKDSLFNNKWCWENWTVDVKEWN